MNKQLSLVLACFLLSSCTIYPFTYTNPQTGTKIVSLGASFLTKSKGEQITVQNKNLNYSSKEKNEVSAPTNYLFGQTLNTAADLINTAMKK